MTVLLALLLLAQAHPDAGTSFQNPLLVTADRLQVQGKLKQATWYGHVNATRHTTHLKCDKLVAHYRTSEEVSKLECTGNVEVVDGNKWARGERADFDNVTNILVVTGHPEAREGKNYLKGDRIIFDVGKDTVDVERADTIIETRGGPPTLPRTSRGASAGTPGSPVGTGSATKPSAEDAGTR